MVKNFIFGIQALAREIRIFILHMFGNTTILGFFFGFFFTLLVSSLVITRDPRSIPLILRYSAADGFTKFVNKKSGGRGKNGTINVSFVKFLKIYSQIRILFLMAFIIFCVMILTIVLMANSFQIV